MNAMKFDEWFVAQHGKRPSKKSLDELMQERNDFAARADDARRLFEACDLWEDRRTSALWAWQVRYGASEYPRLTAAQCELYNALREVE